MNFSEPAKIITQLPLDFDMKRKTPMRSIEQRRNAKTKRARQNVEPFSCERPSLIWKVVVLVGAVAIGAAALIQGVFNGSN